MTTANATAANAIAPVAKVYGQPLDLSVLNPQETEFNTFIDRVIIGQPKGKAAARRAYRRTMSKLRTGSSPVYSILALGPTTVGKSELAYRLAEFLHGDRTAVLKLDGSEYKDDSRLTHLIGGSAQWTGFVDKKRADYVPPRPDEKDTMCELNQHNLNWSRKGSKSPFTVVLVDEWDKACKDFNDVMLSILRDGVYTLGNGEVVDFRNCIFIFTANLGARDVEQAVEKAANPIGFRTGDTRLTTTDTEALFNKHLKDFTAPEFRARITENGEIVVFEKLNAEQIGQVRDLKIAEMQAHVRKVAKVTIDVDDAGRKVLLDLAMANDGTVANLNGVLKSHVTDNLDNQLIVGGIKERDNILLTADEAGKAVVFQVEQKGLLIVSPDSDEYRELTAEMDEQLAAAAQTPEGRRRRRRENGGLIDEAALAEIAAAARAAAGEGDAASTTKKPKIRQPFKVTVISQTSEQLEQARRDLDKVFAELDIKKLAEETKFGIGIQTNVGVAMGNLTEMSVQADIADMVALRERAPAIGIRTEEAAL